MAQPEIISQLYENVLQNDIDLLNINDTAIRTAIQNMKEVYKPNHNRLTDQVLELADYDDPAHRCAYLHKYAPLHTALMSDMLANAMKNPHFKRIIAEFVHNGYINLCSLGGGPGCDVLGVIFVLSAEFGFFQMSATVVEFMENWKLTFDSLIYELRYGDFYGNLGDFVQPQNFEWGYIKHNLLSKMSKDVNKTIQRAHIVTMVKFVSSVSCKDTAEMLKKIFRSMKRGALIFYIDNAGGGFHKLIQGCAQECDMVTVFGPLKHQTYNRELDFNVQRFGYTPCLETKVTFHVWRKPGASENQYLTSDSDYLNNYEPRIQTSQRTVNTTINQYNVTNIYQEEYDYDDTDSDESVESDSEKEDTCCVIL